MKFFKKHSATIPAVITASVIFYWISIVLSVNKNIYDLIYIGRSFVEKSQVSPIINSQKRYSQIGYGYDGQFFYYIALDPSKAYHYIDDPPYRYARILYPLVARVFSFGRPQLIAYSLLFINVVSLIGTVYLLSSYLKRFNISPYISLIYAFYPGVFVSLGHDLNELLAYFLTMTGVYFFDPKRTKKLITSSIFFILAIFTREATALFSISFGAALIFAISKLDKQIQINQDWKKGIAFCLSILFPYFLYLLFLRFRFGPDPSPHLLFFPLILFHFWPWSNHITLVLLPSLILGIILAHFFKRGYLTASVTALLMNLLLLLVLIPDDYSMYANIGRYANGLVFATIISLPSVIHLNRKLIKLVIGAALLWFQAWIVSPQFIGGQELGIYIYFISMVLLLLYIKSS